MNYSDLRVYNCPVYMLPPPIVTFMTLLTNQRINVSTYQPHFTIFAHFQKP